MTTVTGRAAIDGGVFIPRFCHPARFCSRRLQKTVYTIAPVRDKEKAGEGKGKKRPEENETSLAQARQLLGRHVEIFDAMPKNEAQFMNVYGYSPRDRQMKYIRKADVDLTHAVKDNFLRSYEGTSKRKYLHFLDESKADHIIIIGHNHKGRFRFANGDELDIDTMARLAVKKHKTPVVLSCKASAYTESVASTIRANAL